MGSSLRTSRDHHWSVVTCSINEILPSFLLLGLHEHPKTTAPCCNTRCQSCLTWNSTTPRNCSFKLYPVRAEIFFVWTSSNLRTWKQILESCQEVTYKICTRDVDEHACCKREYPLLCFIVWTWEQVMFKGLSDRISVLLLILLIAHGYSWSTPQLHTTHTVP